MSIKEAFEKDISSFQVEDEKCWNVLGHKYQPLVDSESCYAWLSYDPSGTFVPPHTHGEHDEHIFVLEGEYSLYLDGKWSTAGPGEMVIWPKGSLHSYEVATKEPARAIFWVSPGGQLSQLFSELHNVDDPNDVVSLSKNREVFFVNLDDAPGYK